MTGLFALLTGLLYGWLLHLNWQRAQDHRWAQALWSITNDSENTVDALSSTYPFE